MWIAAWLGCSARTEPATPRPPPHFDDWPALVAAAARGTPADGRRIAAGIDPGPPTEGPGASEAATTLGSALGMAVTAEDADELVDAVVVGSSACLACHAGQPAPSPPPWSHHAAADALADAAAWGRVLPPGDDAATEALSRAWTAGGLRASLAACRSCHP